MKKRWRLLASAVLIVAFAISMRAQSVRLPGPADILRLANVSDVQVSPGGQWLAYTVSTIDGEKSISTLWLARTRELLSTPATTRDTQRTVATTPLLSGSWNVSSPRWSPDGETIAFLGTHEGANGLWVVSMRMREPRFLANIQSTNFFITYAGESIAWSPDSKRIAYLSAVDEPNAAAGPNRTDDPRVVDRIQYKSRTGFSDTRRTHIFMVSVDREESRQLTSGPFYDHALSFSPRGDEVVFLSNHESDPDSINNSDIFAVDLSGQVRQITQTSGCEYDPSWSPDGKWIAYTATKRDVTTIDSVAEDQHVWVIAAAGGAGREITASLDRRARNPRWSSSGARIYFLAGDEGQTKIWTVRPDGGELKERLSRPEKPGDEKADRYEFPSRPFQISDFSLSSQAEVLAFVSSDALHPAEVWMTPAATSLTAVNVTRHDYGFVQNFALVQPEEFKFKSYDGTLIQAWLMKPATWHSDNKYPLILSIHGGPHGMYGWGFNSTFQVLAAHGYAVLYLNPRGSSGYGQKFSDGTLNEWGGGDYKDLMWGVDEALRRYPWIDRDRMGVTGGSYGGFMTNWIITQTPRFKCAVSIASVSNLISFYSTSLYQDLIHAEFGGFPWDNYDLLWQWSPLRYVRQVQTPTLFLHGEQDNDVHITQAEEMYMGLKRRGVETVLVRYPREGHGFREPQHRVDALERTLAWFDRFLK